MTSGAEAMAGPESSEVERVGLAWLETWSLKPPRAKMGLPALI